MSVEWVRHFTNFQGNNEWSPLINEGFFGQDNGSGSYVPIPPIVRACSHELIIIGASSPDASPTWNTGAWVTALLEVKLGVNSNIAGLAEINREIVPLNRFKLIRIADFEQEESAIRISFPYWLKRVNIEVWYYIRPLNTDVQEALSRIESSFNI